MRVGHRQASNAKGRTRQGAAFFLGDAEERKHLQTGKGHQHLTWWNPQNARAEFYRDSYWFRFPDILDTVAVGVIPDVVADSARRSGLIIQTSVDTQT